VINKIKFLILFISSLILFSCSDEPTSIGLDKLGNDLLNIKTINSADDSISQVSSYKHEKVSLGSSSRLLLGKSSNTEASILIKFNIALEESLEEDILNDSINIISSELQLNQTYNFGVESVPFDFTIHEVTSDWSVNFTEDSITSLIYVDEDLSIEKEINDSLTTVKLNTLNNPLIQNWLKIAADTSLDADKGIYLKPTSNTQKVLGYQALTSSFENFPIINVVIEKPGVYVDTISFITTLDVGVITGTLPVVSDENIVLQSGYIITSKLLFYIPELPPNSIINSAELTLTLDTNETVVGSNFSNALNVYYLYDSTNTDSLSSAVSLLRSGNQFTGNITLFVREWLVGNNHGLYITPGSTLTGVELFAVKGSNAAIISERPLLKINYTEKK